MVIRRLAIGQYFTTLMRRLRISIVVATPISQSISEDEDAAQGCVRYSSAWQIGGQRGRTCYISLSHAYSIIYMRRLCSHHRVALDDTINEVALRRFCRRRRIRPSRGVCRGNHHIIGVAPIKLIARIQPLVECHFSIS